MTGRRIALAFLAGLIVSLATLRASAAGREILSLDGPWRFLKGDVAGAEQAAFVDSQWRIVQAPHDWSIEGPFAETNSSGGAGAFLPTGVAWYRKRFALPAEDLGRCVSVEFDGVMQAGDVWINGMHLGHQPNAAAGFRYRLPGSMLGFGNGTNNILCVCADASASLPSGYAGAGLCRRVRLVVTDPVHFAVDGMTVSSPAISPTEATVKMETAITNEFPEPCEISVQASVLAPDGEPVGDLESSEVVGAHSAARAERQVAFPNPHFWSLGDPQRYRAVIRLHANGRLADNQTTTFCIRSVHFGAEAEAAPAKAGGGSAGADDLACRLNGMQVRLHPVVLHADGGAFGLAVPLSIWEARLRTLKSLGVNAVRTASPPPAPEFFDLCERLGLLVLDPLAGRQTRATNPGDDGIDYLGESPGWPVIGHASGLLDRTGAIRPFARERQSRWTSAPMVAVARRGAEDGTLLADWTPANAPPHREDIVVYSNCRQVELYLNGKSLGKKMAADDASPRQWDVPFAAGSLRAIGRNDRGRAVATNELRTAGKAVSIALATDAKTLPANGDDVAIVRATVVDAKGILVPRAGDWITFTVTGPGFIAAVDNADPTRHESLQANSCRAVRGTCAAYLRAGFPGKIKLTAAAAALQPGSIVIPTAGPGIVP